MNRGLPRLVATLLLAAGALARAQPVNEDHVRVGSHSPEAWAMNYVTAATLLTGFGESPALGPGQWALGLGLGHVPPLDARQRRVGFSGTKVEDLNRSPLFGRVRGWLGLPGGFVAELGYTPPLQIDGARPRDLVAAAIGRRVWQQDGWTLSLRLHGQHGTARGDITCPAALAQVEDAGADPFGCQAPSDDRIDLNYYGADATLGFGAPGSGWRGHLALGRTRVEPRVQVHALTFGALDRSRLIGGGWLDHLALGARRELDAHWSIAGEVLYVPIEVARGPDAARGNDPFWSLRLMLRYAR